MRELNRNVMMETVKFLNKIVAYKKSNKMDEYNVSLMFAPNIFRTISGKDPMTIEHIEKMQIHTHNMMELMTSFDYIFAEWLPYNHLHEAKDQIVESCL